ncbi:20S-pre-rRNA D-site endonuclease nob1 [Pseudogymnoascus australis]
MATETPKPIHTLVLDAAPIITNTPSLSTLLAQSTELYTVPHVLAEIRDVAARSRLETTLLPFLKLRTPRPASVKAVTDFARRTGDLEVLREKVEEGGDKEGVKEEAKEEVKEEVKEVKPIIESRGAWGTKIPTAEPVVAEAEGEVTKDVEIPAEVAEVPAKEAEVAEVKAEEPTPESTEEQTEVKSTEESLAALSITPSEEPSAITADAPEEVEESESEDDEGGWITPSNIKKVQAKETAGPAAPEPEVKTMQVACITSDFAMQNVLLRMNLNLLSPTLTRVRQLKTWVLRCHACFDVTKDMSKQFCTRCGKPTLLRVSCSTEKDGTFKVHLKKNKQWSSRGNVYSIPKPVAGSANTRAGGGGKGGWGQTLILAEDQKEYVQATERAKRTKERDLMDEDYLPGLLSGNRRGPGGRPMVGAGRNVNSKKRH